MASSPDDAASTAQERARALAEWLPELLDDAQTWIVADVKHALRAVSETTGVARRWEPLSRRQEQWTGRASRRSSLRRATSSEATVASAQLHALLAFLLQDCSPAEFAAAVQALACGLAPPILAVRRRFLDAAAGAAQALELLRRGVAPACFLEAQAVLAAQQQGGCCADASAAAPSRRVFEQWVARSKPGDAALFDVIASLCGLLPGFEPRSDAGKGACILQHLMEHMPYRLDLVYDLVSAGLSASVGAPLRETLAAHLFDRSTTDDEDAGAEADGVSSTVLRWAAHMLSDGGVAAEDEEGEENEEEEEEDEADASATAEAGGVGAQPAPAEVRPPEVEVKAQVANVAVAKAAGGKAVEAVKEPATSEAPPVAAASPALASLPLADAAAAPSPPSPPSPSPSPPSRSPQPQRPSPVVAACPEPALRDTGALTLSSAGGAGTAVRLSEGLRKRPQQQTSGRVETHEETCPRPAADTGGVEEIEVEESSAVAPAASAQQPQEGAGRRREVGSSLACGRHKANILSSRPPPASDVTRGHSGTSIASGGAGDSSGLVRRTEEVEAQQDTSCVGVHPAEAVAAAAPGYSAQHLIAGTPPVQPAAVPAGALPSESASASATATVSEETCGDDGAFVLDARVEAPPPASALPRPLLRPAAAAAVCGIVEEEVSPDASPLGAAEASAGAGAGTGTAGQAPSLYPRHTIGRGVLSSPVPTSISGAGEMHAGSPDPAPAARSLLVRPPVLGGMRAAAERVHAQESSPGGGDGSKGSAADADYPALALHPDLRLSRPSSRRGDGSSATLSSSAAAAAGRRWPQAEGAAAAAAVRTAVAEEESAGSVAASHASDPAWQRAGYSSAAAAAVSAAASRNGRRFAEEVEEEACADGDECGSDAGCERGRRRRVSAGAEVSLDAAAQAPTRVLSARPSARTPSGARRRLGASSKAAWVTVEEEEVAGGGGGVGGASPPPPPPPLSPESPRVPPPPPQAVSAVRPRLFYSAASSTPSASASAAPSAAAATTQQRAADEGSRGLRGGTPPPAVQASQADARGKIFVEDLVDADDDEAGDAAVPDSFSPTAASAPATAAVQAAAAQVAEAARFAASPAVFGEGTLRASAAASASAARARTAEVAAVARAPQRAAARHAVVTVDETVEPAESSPPASPAPRLPAPEQAPQTEQELATAAAASGKRVVSSDALPRGVWRPTVLKGTPPPQQHTGTQKRWLDQELVESEAEAETQAHQHQHQQQEQQQQTWPWHGNDANNVSLSNVAQPRQSPFVSPLPARKAAKGQRCVYEDNALRGALRHSEELDADGRFVSSVLGRNTRGNGHAFTAPLKKGAVARMRAAAAADIQRVWRGRAGRGRAAERRTLIYGPRPKAQHGSSARRRQQTTPPPPHQRRGGSKQRRAPASTRGSNTLYASPPPLAVY